MKRSTSPFHRLRLGAWVLLLSLVGSVSSNAQNPVQAGAVAATPAAPPQRNAQNPVQAGAVAATPAAPPQLPRFDFEFYGGSPAEFVKELSKAAGGDVNIIIPDGVEDLRIPKLKLSQVTVQDVIYGVSFIGSSFRGLPGAERAYQIQPSGGGGPNMPLSSHVVWILSSVRNQISTKPNSSLKVFSLARYLGKPEQGLHSVEDIITAVEAGWKMQEITAQPKLTYHPETKLLMAFGQEAHLTLITDVLKQLEPPVPAPVQKAKIDPEVLKTLEKGGLLLPQEPLKSK